jgi:hypothetical protein
MPKTRCAAFALAGKAAPEKRAEAVPAFVAKNTPLMLRPNPSPRSGATARNNANPPVSLAGAYGLRRASHDALPTRTQKSPR